MAASMSNVCNGDTHESEFLCLYPTSDILAQYIYIAVPSKSPPFNPTSTTSLRIKSGLILLVLLNYLMGSYKEEENRDGISYNRFRKIVKACVACLASFLISMVGGLILVWWVVKHHHSNTQLWMVPVGLIIFITPVIVFFSTFISDLCKPKEAGVSRLNHPVMPLDNSVGDPER
ncbi:unnamed protein product [Camellia sinensis]